MKTTFVLGAGFSVEAGFPLVRDLRERVLRFIEFDRHARYKLFLEPGRSGFEEGIFYAELREADPGGHLLLKSYLLS